MSNKDLKDLIEKSKNEPIIEHLNIPYEFIKSLDDEEIKSGISNILKDEIKKVGKSIKDSCIDDIIKEIQVKIGGLKNE